MVLYKCYSCNNYVEYDKLAYERMILVLEDSITPYRGICNKCEHPLFDSLSQTGGLDGKGLLGEFRKIHQFL